MRRQTRRPRPFIAFLMIVGLQTAFAQGRAIETRLVSQMPDSLRAHADSLVALVRPELRSWIAAQAVLARDTAIDPTRVEAALQAAIETRLEGQNASQADRASLRKLVCVEAMQQSFPIFDSLVAVFKTASELMTQVSFAQSELREAAAEVASNDPGDTCRTARCAAIVERLTAVARARERANATLGSRASTLSASIVTVADLRHQTAVIDAVYDEVFHETKMRRRAWRRVGDRDSRLMEMIRRADATLASMPAPNLEALH